MAGPGWRTVGAVARNVARQAVARLPVQVSAPITRAGFACASSGFAMAGAACALGLRLA